jgi:hypothetical protein
MEQVRESPIQTKHMIKGKAGEERDQEGFVEIVMPHRREHWQHLYDMASLMHENPSIRTVFIVHKTCNYNITN